MCNCSCSYFNLANAFINNLLFPLRNSAPLAEHVSSVHTHKVKQWSLAVRLSVSPAFSSHHYTCPHEHTCREMISFVLTLMLSLTFILRNSCKVKQNQPMQKDFDGQVGVDNCLLLSFLATPDSCGSISSWKKHIQSVWLLLLKDDHHGGHATDEEKLASSASVKPDKDQSSE